MREQLGREPIVPPGERLDPYMKRFVGNLLELVAPRGRRAVELIPGTARSVGADRVAEAERS